MTLNIVMQYYADLSFNANFRQSFHRFWRCALFCSPEHRHSYNDKLQVFYKSGYDKGFLTR